jgi:hypothetical protein
MDCGFYLNDEKSLEFINFATHQFFRTPKLREIVSQLDNPIPGLDLNRTWLIESHIFATNLGARIYVERNTYKFTFLNNQTSVPFITGDQPVINLNTHEDKELKLYYPLTPSVALIFAKDKAASCKTVRQPSSIEVEFYNQQMYSNSVDQIYSNDRGYLEKLATSPKNLLAAD